MKNNSFFKWVDKLSNNMKTTTVIFISSFMINFFFLTIIVLISFFTDENMAKEGLFEIIAVPSLISMLSSNGVFFLILGFIAAGSGRPIDKLVKKAEIEGGLSTEDQKIFQRFHYKVINRIIITQFTAIALTLVITVLLNSVWGQDPDIKYQAFADDSWITFFLIAGTLLICTIAQIVKVNTTIGFKKSKVGINQIEKNLKYHGLTKKLLIMVIAFITFSGSLIATIWLSSTRNVAYTGSNLAWYHAFSAFVVNKYGADGKFTLPVKSKDVLIAEQQKIIYRKRGEYINLFVDCSRDGVITYDESKELIKMYDELMEFELDKKPYQAHEGQKRNTLIAMVIILIYGVGVTLFYTREYKSQIMSIIEKMDDMIEGEKDLSKRITIESEDDLAKLSERFNAILDQQEYQMREIIENIDDIKSSLNAVNNSINSVEKDITDIKDKSFNVYELSGEQNKEIQSAKESVNDIIKSIQNINNNVSDQASYVEQSSASIEEMISSIKGIGEMINNSNQLSKDLLKEAREGSTYITDSTKTMNEIKEASDTVSEIIVSISTIAKKTNLLAMNASIEAAHAGKSGKGFAVVAEEIRKLAETSSNSANEIIEQITNMAELIDKGVMLSNDANKAFKTILKVIKESNELMNNIANATKEQNIGANEISTSISNMVESADKIKDLAELQKEKSNTVSEKVETAVVSSSKITNASENQKQSVLSITDSIKLLRDTMDNTLNSTKSITEITSQFKFSSKSKQPKSLKPGDDRKLL